MEVNEAIEKLSCIYTEVSTDDDREAIDMAIEALKEKRPHGEWIPKAVHNCWTRFECSVCGYYHQPVHDFGESKPEFNFCPNCGADMRKEGEKK